MVKTAKDILIKAEIKPLLAYTFSDEINLLFYKKIDLPFNGKIGRILSLLSSYATSSLQFYLLSLGKAKIFPVFSAQAFKVKSDKKILEYFYWRCSASLRNFLKEYTLKVLGKSSFSSLKRKLLKSFVKRE
jgi:tRNA(His) 5'-end guanylyltransferase